MKKIAIKSFVVLSLGLLSSCSLSAPLFVTDNANKGNKVGESSFKTILGFYPFKADYSIETAAKNGGIKKIATVDMKVKGGFFGTTYTTVVTGE